MKKSSNGSHYSVSKTAAKKGVFRDIQTGKSVTRVMNKRVYDEATERASEKIREYMQQRKAS